MECNLRGIGSTSDDRDTLPVHRDIQTSPELRTPPDSEPFSGRDSTTHHASGAFDSSHPVESSHIPPEGILFLASQYSIPSHPQKPLATLPPTVYTNHPKSQLGSTPSPLRSTENGTVTHRYRKRQHIYAKEVSLHSLGHYEVVIGISAQSPSAR